MTVVMKIVRQLIPLLLLPLCLLASVLAAAPWLRSFPVSVAGVPFYGAAILSVLVPLVTARVRPNWLLLGVAVDVVIFALYSLTVVLRDPLDVHGLVQGLYHGPSQVLTFALPLVSPRNLMIAPVALIWLGGALAGECVARRWYTMLPYVGFLVSFGLAYAGTQRAAGLNTDSARVRETVLGATLLVTLLLMRVAQAWVRQDETAESTQPDGILPMRGLVVGLVTTLVVAVGASLLVQTDAFPKKANTPQRVPSVNDSNPLSPLSFVAGLRPRTAKDTPTTLFTVRVYQPNPGYFSIANVDYYDGSGWSFTRTFRPSGGVLPADTDPALRPKRSVTQQYRISSGPLTSGPWMPFLYRAQKVTGTSVNIDPASGMIVPAGRLTGGETYTVRSGIPTVTFNRLKAATATPDTVTSTGDTQLPPGVRITLDRLINTLSDETHTPSSPAVPFLQAVQRYLLANYTLSSAAQGSATGGSATSSPTPSTSSSPPASTPVSTPKSTPKTTPKTSPKTTPKTHHKRDVLVRPLAAKTKSKTHVKRTTAAKHTTPPAPATTPSTTPTPSPSVKGPAGDLAGSTGFADVLATIQGNRQGSPEQYATLVALIARELGVPARVVTGFRVDPKGNATTVGPGQYAVTSADAWSWVEVPINDAGWVVLDATPGRFSNAQKQTASGAAPPPTTSAPPSQNPLLSAGNGGHAVAKKSATPSTSSTTNHALLIAIIVVIGLLLIVLLLILASRKSVRAARRRRSPDPRTRVIGAWQESMDTLTEAGLPELTTMTSAEIAELAGEQFGPESGRATAALGAAANSVAYSAATVVAPEEADAAWAEQRALRRQVRSQLGWRGRIAASLRYHRPKRTETPVSPRSWADRADVVRPNRARRRYKGRRRAH